MMMTDNSSPGGSAGNGSKGEEERGTRSKEGRNNNGREIRSVTLSAPGKVILFGEHVILYKSVSSVYFINPKSFQIEGLGLFH